MVLEATVVILDNSEWMRNGDYIPSRLDAQQDAAYLICNTKRQSNVENSVALMTMGGPSPKVLVTLTSEQSKLQHALASIRLDGHSSCSFASALQIAQLILRNRQNNNQRQRIVVFVGSPLGLTIENQLSSLASIGKLLKKNRVALDIISFGNLEDNEAAIIHILAAVGGFDLTIAKRNINEALLDPSCDCHLLTVKAGESIHEALMTSPILLGSDGSAQVGDFGMNDDMDPELAMALKLSLEEEKARIEKEKASEKPMESINLNDNDNDHTGHDMAVDEEDEEAMMARAIAMSLETAAKGPKSDPSPSNGE